ncbi:MAG: PD40 domain-containing protein [Balneolaceae bacterium]|nr:PD40 domain-containing protein [Balneolaceae bacterium]MBO6547033.1 PD40 domain-containing protein [Balneolaceae bacterium]MBO6648020.1 PD40 domain-containing protein [Balneolaceae bacterium]
MKFLFITLLLLLSSSVLQAQSLSEVINTDANEYGIAFITNDLICFTRSYGEKRLMLTQRKGDTWTEPVVAPFSKDWDSEYPSFDITTSRLYFGSVRPKPNTDESQNSNDIWYVEYDNGSWGEPVHLGGNFSMKGIDSGGFGVGERVYFHSDRSGSGMYSVDIYMASSESETPKKLSMSTETVDGEVHLFNNGNSMLFMSGGHGAIGNSDIFVSHFLNGEWSTPESVDTTGSVNTAAWEYAPSLSPDGSTLFFTRISNRNADIISTPVESLTATLIQN